MQRPTTTTLAALVIVVCFGCASTPDTVAPDVLAGYKRIGVVSITAQTFSRVYAGLLSVEREQIDSSSWDIDSTYERQIATELSALGGFEVVAGAYSRPEFSRLGFQDGGVNWDALESPIKDYCAKNQVNAILAAVKAYGNDFISNSHQRLDGAGFFASGTNFHVRGRGFLLLITIVALVDCQTARPVATRGLASLRDGLPGQILRASPVISVPQEIARAPLKQLTEAQIAMIKDNLVELPKKSWEPTLRAIFGK
jgi:hypothetical protein